MASKITVKEGQTLIINGSEKFAKNEDLITINNEINDLKRYTKNLCITSDDENILNYCIKPANKTIDFGIYPKIINDEFYAPKGSGSSLTAGDGINISDDKINVVTDINAYVAKELFETNKYNFEPFADPSAIYPIVKLLGTSLKQITDILGKIFNPDKVADFPNAEIDKQVKQISQILPYKLDNSKSYIISYQYGNYQTTEPIGFSYDGKETKLNQFKHISDNQRATIFATTLPYNNRVFIDYNLNDPENPKLEIITDYSDTTDENSIQFISGIGLFELPNMQGIQVFTNDNKSSM